MIIPLAMRASEEKEGILVRHFILDKEQAEAEDLKIKSDWQSDFKTLSQN